MICIQTCLFPGLQGVKFLSANPSAGETNKNKFLEVFFNCELAVTVKLASKFGCFGWEQEHSIKKQRKMCAKKEKLEMLGSIV